MPEEISDRALAEDILAWHSGQESALYSVGSCIYASRRDMIEPETLELAVAELKPHDQLLAERLEQWGKHWFSITPFVKAYIDCALWSSSCNETEDDDTSLSERYSMADITSGSMERIKRECDEFISKCKPEDLALQRDDQNGHDFWLTRNHHGAGFWDRGLGEAGERLTEVAHSFGESDVYIGEDRRLHFT